MMRVLLVTDAFPPICGGSGWSTYELARGLRRLGHDVLILRPRPGQPDGIVTRTQYEDFTIHEAGAFAPPLPYVRNYFKNERLTRRLTGTLVPFIREQQVDIVHGQHVLSCPATVAAARIAGVPSVCTVRDYWPVCYWSDLIHDYRAPALCPACSAGMMTRCIRPRAGAAWPAALPFIPYMRANLRRKQTALAGADAVIAVSSTIGRDLVARAPALAEARTRVEIIPNPVDVRAIRAALDTPPPRLQALASSAASPGHDAGSGPSHAGAVSAAMPPSAIADDAPYAIYVGKLAPNKGTGKLLTAIARARLAWPLVIVGDGPDRAAVEAAARAAGRDVRFTGWLDRAEALRWLAHARLLVFPSHGPESLSRVLLEASALGVPAAAMDTGGTRDIITHEQTGLLSSTPEELGDHVARLVDDAALRARLGAAARAWVDARFEAGAVVSRIASLYDDLRATRRARAGVSDSAAGPPRRADVDSVAGAPEADAGAAVTGASAGGASSNPARADDAGGGFGAADGGPGPDGADTNRPERGARRA